MRCNARDCMRGARGKTGYCIRHGGGRRCQKKGCSKGTADKCEGYCTRHYREYVQDLSHGGKLNSDSIKVKKDSKSEAKKECNETTQNGNEETTSPTMQGESKIGYEISANAVISDTKKEDDQNFTFHSSANANSNHHCQLQYFSAPISDSTNPHKRRCIEYQAIPMRAIYPVSMAHPVPAVSQIQAPHLLPIQTSDPNSYQRVHPSHAYPCNSVVIQHHPVPQFKQPTNIPIPISAYPYHPPPPHHMIHNRAHQHHQQYQFHHLQHHQQKQQYLPNPYPLM